MLFIDLGNIGGVVGSGWGLGDEEFILLNEY